MFIVQLSDKLQEKSRHRTEAHLAVALDHAEHGHARRAASTLRRAPTRFAADVDLIGFHRPHHLRCCIVAHAVTQTPQHEQRRLGRYLRLTR
jgi:hypothetical protein